MNKTTKIRMCVIEVKAVVEGEMILGIMIDWNYINFKLSGSFSYFIFFFLKVRGTPRTTLLP